MDQIFLGYLLRTLPTFQDILETLTIAIHQQLQPSEALALAVVATTGTMSFWWKGVHNLHIVWLSVHAEAD